MIYHCKWILLQAPHMSGLQFIMQSMTACILSLSFSYILKLISLMNFDGSLHLQFGICNAFPLTISELAVGALQTTAPLQPCCVFPKYPPEDAAPGTLRGWSCVGSAGTESSQGLVHAGSETEIDKVFDLRPWRIRRVKVKQTYNKNRSL